MLHQLKGNISISRAPRYYILQQKQNRNRILIFFKVFKNIDWDSRKKATTDRSGCISKNDFESCFTYKYLWYKMEPEQIDFDNPFEIEEGNQMR